MGFTEEEAAKALWYAQNDHDAALAWLLSDRQVHYASWLHTLSLPLLLLKELTGLGRRRSIPMMKGMKKGTTLTRRQSVIR